MRETRICVVCGAEKDMEEMVYAADSWICSTKECLLGALENVYEELQRVVK
jgi:hypothetical protein